MCSGPGQTDLQVHVGLLKFLTDCSGNGTAKAMVPLDAYPAS